VGDAVQQMDQATQQNAALVEQSAAAAASLKQQAQELVDAVAVFRVHGGSAAPRGGSATPAGGWGGAERRGPDRAKNVARPAFGAKKPAAKPATATPAVTAQAAAGTAAASEPSAARKTGTDDDWTTF